MEKPYEVLYLGTAANTVVMIKVLNVRGCTAFTCRSVATLKGSVSMHTLRLQHRTTLLRCAQVLVHTSQSRLLPARRP